MNFYLAQINSKLYLTQVIPYQAGWSIVEAIGKGDFVIKTQENDEVRKIALLRDDKIKLMKSLINKSSNEFNKKSQEDDDSEKAARGMCGTER